MTKPTKGAVLVAVDGSRNSIVAAGVGARMAQWLGMQVGLVHVLDVPQLSFWAGVESRLKGDIGEQAEAMLADISEKIRRTCDLAPEFYIVDGEPADAISKLVRAHPEIVFVVAGREGVGSEKKTELLRDRAGNRLGAKLADLLPVPVLVVPPDPSQFFPSMHCEG
ncbi:MAG TPA: universal stress protein [Burkholderiales bacterium]|nr:universal stress protein [Burkholderiales bacterium]